MEPDSRGGDFSGRSRHKICPKCGEQLSRSPTSFFLSDTLPSVKDKDLARVYEERGLMLEAFACRKCDYIEFWCLLTPIKC